MAYALLNLFFLTFLLPFSAVAQNNGTVPLGTSLIAADNSKPWLSPSSDFAFGFQKIQEINLFLLCIWYYKIPDETIVWHGNEGNAVPSGSKVELSADRGLALSDPQGKELWISGEFSLNGVSYGFMNNTGNFVLFRSDSSKLWESFRYPTDTILPTQIMEAGGELSSRQNERNFLRGRFRFRLLQTGDLVLLNSNFPDNPYYVNHTSDPSNSTNSGYQLIFRETGHLYILRRDGQLFDLTQLMLPPDYYFRATLNFDGIFAQYFHSKTSTGNPNWTPLWSQPDNICYTSSGVCGENSVCRLNDDKRAICECPQGYSLLDLNDTYGSCRPSFTLSCDEDSGRNLYDLRELIDTDWAGSDEELLRPTREDVCRSACLNDCSCAVAFFRNDSCWKKKLPLSNGRKDSGLNGKALVKFRKVDVPLGSPRPQIQGKRCKIRQ